MGDGEGEKLGVAGHARAAADRAAGAGIELGKAGETEGGHGGMIRLKHVPHNAYGLASVLPRDSGYREKFGKGNEEERFVYLMLWRMSGTKRGRVMMWERDINEICCISIFK